MITDIGLSLDYQWIIIGLVDVFDLHPSHHLVSLGLWSRQQVLSHAYSNGHRGAPKDPVEADNGEVFATEIFIGRTLLVNIGKSMERSTMFNG